MKREFTAAVWHDNDWCIAQALEVDVTSQGESVEAALANLREALELYFAQPFAVEWSELHRIEVEVGADAEAEVAVV